MTKQEHDKTAAMELSAVQHDEVKTVVEKINELEWRVSVIDNKTDLTQEDTDELDEISECLDGLLAEDMEEVNQATDNGEGASAKMCKAFSIKLEIE